MDPSIYFALHNFPVIFMPNSFIDPSLRTMTSKRPRTMKETSALGSKVILLRIPLSYRYTVHDVENKATPTDIYRSSSTADACRCCQVESLSIASSHNFPRFNCVNNWSNILPSFKFNLFLMLA